MNYTVEHQKHGIITLKREDTVVLISSQPARVADVLHDMLVHNGKLTLIPEPPKETR